MSLEKIKKLRKLIEYHNDKYFIEQNPEISDIEYDQLFYELRELEEKFPQFQNLNSPINKIGGIAENTFTKIPHNFPMLSLGKCRNWEEFEKWFLKINTKVNKFVFEVKLDGLAVSLTYENGKLIRGLTRGDGLIGEDITATILTIPNIPKYINNKNHVEVRGEIILLKSGLKEINKIRMQNNEKFYDNVRNAASGLLRTKNPIKEMGQYLQFGAYMFSQKENKKNSHSEDMEYLKLLGFIIIDDLIQGFKIDIKCSNKIEKDLSLIKDKFDAIYKIREDLDFAIDGIVIKTDLYLDQQELGEKINVPNWATAFKFEAERVMTQLLGVEHLLGAKGNITPRAILNPVRVCNSTVSRTTLHNYDEIKRLGIKIGDYVWIERRGDVIPKIVGFVKELRTGTEIDIINPINCPECNSILNWKKGIPRCDNKDCCGGQMFKVQNYIKSLEIDEFGPSLIEKLFDTGLISNFTDIYNLKLEDISNLERMGEKSAIKVLNNIEKSKSVPLWKIIAGLTIKNIGIEMGKELSKKYKTLDNFAKCTQDELKTIDGFGDIMPQNIIGWLSNDKNIKLINILIELGIGQNNAVEAVVNINKLKGSKFSFTGELSLPRKKIEQIISQNGGEITSIKKGIQFLIIGNGAKEHKILKSQQLGAQIITEEEFLKMLE